MYLIIMSYNYAIWPGAMLLISGAERNNKGIQCLIKKNEKYNLSGFLPADSRSNWEE